MCRFKDLVKYNYSYTFTTSGSFRESIGIVNYLSFGAFVGFVFLKWQRPQSC